MALANCGNYGQIFTAMHFIPDFSRPSQWSGRLSPRWSLGQELAQLSASDQSRTNFGHSSCRLSAVSCQLSAVSFRSPLPVCSCQSSPPIRFFQEPCRIFRVIESRCDKRATDLKTGVASQKLVGIAPASLAANGDARLTCPNTIVSSGVAGPRIAAPDARTNF